MPLAATGALGQTYRAPLQAAANYTPTASGGQELVFTMTVDPNKQNYVTIRMWGGDDSSAYTYLLGYNPQDNGLDLSSNPAAFPNRFYYSTEYIPLSMTQGKSSVQLVLFQTGFSSGIGRPVYSAYTHTDPHFIPSGADPTGTKLTVTGQLPLSTLNASQIVSYLQTNRQKIYQNTGTPANPSDYYDQILARQVTASTTGAPPETIGLDLYTNVANWATSNPSATADQWRDQCGSGGHGPGYTTAPDEMLSVLTATYFLPPFTDANGNTVAGLDHYHDSTIIPRIVSCLDGTSYLQSSDGHYQGQPYPVWNGVTSTPRAAGHTYAGSTSRSPGWSISLEGTDTETIGRIILQLLNDPTSAPLFQNYLTQSYDADLTGGSMMRAYAYERMLNNQINFLYTTYWTGTVSQGLFNITGEYSEELALAKLQALYPYPGTTSTFPNDSYSYPINYPTATQAQVTSRVLQITGAEAAVDLPNLYVSGVTAYGISPGGFGEAGGSLSCGYDGRYGSILPWDANRISAIAANDSTLSSQQLAQIRTQAQAATNGYLRFISPLENYQGGEDLFTLAQEDYITYRDPYDTNADSGSFTVGAGYESSDPSLGVNSALEQRGAYLEVLYNHPPGTGKGGNDQLQYLATMGSFETTLRGLINVNPSTLTALPGESGQPNSASIDSITGTSAIYYNGERLYMNNNYRNPGHSAVASYVSRIHDTTSTIDRDESAMMPHDSTTVQSDGNLSGALNTPWVMRYGNWLVAGNPSTNSGTSTLTLPAGTGVARDAVSNNTYNMGSTITLPVGGTVALNMPIPTTSQQIATGTYVLTNIASKLLLDCPGGANTPGLQMDQASPPSGNNTQWTFTYVGNGLYTVMNAASGLYLSGAGSQGAGVVQQAADGQPDQQWQLIQSGDSYVLVNQSSGLDINDPGSSTNPGTGMVLYNQDSGANSAWSFQAVSAAQIIPNGIYTVASFQTNFVLDDPGSSTTAGQNILKNVPTGATEQQWVFTYQGNGQYTVKNAASGLYLTPSGLVGSFHYPNVVQEPASGASNQLWTIVYDEWGYNMVNADTGDDALSDQNDPNPGNPAQMNGWSGGLPITWFIRPATITAPATPTNLTASGSTGAATLNWTTSAGANGYDVKRSTTNGSGYTVIAYNVTATTYTDSSAANNTTYYYVVSAVNSGGESPNSTQAATSPVAAPTNLAAVSSTGSVSLTWSVPAGATGYNVLRSLTTGGPYSVVASGISTTTYNDATAANGTTYYYVVTALASGAQSAYSSQVSATPLATPTGVVAAAGNGSISLTWSLSVGATSYSVQRSITSSGGYSTIATGLTTAAYADTTATNGTAYYYEVQAVNSTGSSGLSAPVTATPVAHAGSWVGGGADSNWQTAGNWTSLPSAGQQLYFDGTTGLTSNNNFAANTTFAGITFEGTAGAFVLTGNAIFLSGPVVDNSTSLETINLGILLTNANTAFNTAVGSITMGGVISDGSNTYGITESGTGTLTLNAANTFKGGLTVNSGTVFLGNNTGAGTGTITLAGGTLSYGYYNSFSNPVNVTGNAVMVNTGDQYDGNHTGALTGTGTLTIAPTASSWKWYGSMSGFAGTFIANTNYNIIFEGPSTSGSASAKFQVNGNYFYDEGGAGSTFNMGELSGVGTITANRTGTVTFQVGALNTSTTYSGLFTNNSATVALNKVGTGSLTLTNASTYSGGTTIVAGSLLIGNTSGSALGTGAITVSSGATLGGIGSVSGTVTVATGGNLATGLGGSPGVLNLTGLTLNGGGALNLALASPPLAYGVTVNGTFAASGTTTLNISALSGFGPGTYPIITGAGGISAANFAVGNAPAGYTYTLTVISGSNLNLIVSAPPAPGGLMATSGNGFVTLSWGASAGATSYTVERSLTSGSGYTVLASGLTTTSYLDTSASNGTAYYYVVQATNLAGASPNSNQAVGNPTGTPYTWTGNGGDNNWMTTANWSAAPVSGSPLYFSGTMGLTSNNNFPANTPFNGITFNSGAGAFTLTGNTINLTGDIVNNSTSLETIGLGLVLTAANTNINATNGSITIGGVISDGSNSYAVTIAGPQTVTLNGANTFKGGVTLTSGTLTLGNASALGTGTLNLTGGTLQYGSNVNFGNAINVTGSATMINTGDQSDGFHTGALLGSGTLTIAPTASSWKWNGSMSGFSGTIVANTNYNIIFQGAAANGSATANFQVNGSNFFSQGAGTTFSLGSLSGNGAISVSATGTATFSIGALNTNSTYGGLFADGTGTAALNKVGSGTLTLTNASTNSGGSTITAGTLLVTNTSGSALGTGAVAISSGATLGGTGTVSGATTVATGGNLMPGLGGSPGTLNLTALTLNNGAAVNLILGNTSSPDIVAVNGGFAATGTTTLNINALSGFGPGTYPVITGAQGISAANFAIGTAPAGYTYTVVVSGNNLNLNVTAPAAPANLTATSGNNLVTLNWVASAGATGYTVERSLTSGSGYTVLASGLTTTTYPDTSASNGTTYYYVVEATNLAGASPNSNQATGTPVLPPSIWSGGGADGNWLTAGNWNSVPVTASQLFFGGTTGLASTNNIAANTLLSGITFNSGAGAFSISGNAINLGGDIVNNSTSLETIGLALVLTNSNTNFNAASGNIAVSGAISDGSNTCGITKLGAQTLTLSGSNTFKGGVTLSAGTLVIGSTTPFGTGTLTLNGGTVQKGTTGAGTLANALLVSGTTTLQYAAGSNGDLTLTGALSGNGTINVNSSTVGQSIMFANSSISGFSGTIAYNTISGNGVNISLQANSGDFSAVKFVLSGAILGNTPNKSLSNFNGGSMKLGELSGAGGTITNGYTKATTIQVGALNTSDTYAGAIVDNGASAAFQKVGSGTLTLTNPNTYSGGTTVTAGTLLIANTSGSALGTGPVSVASGAILGGTGTVSGTTTLASGGIIAPGLTGATGVLNLTALTLSSGSILKMDMATTTSSDKVALTGTYSASGTTTVNLNALTGFGAGTYPLVTGATGISASTFVLGTTPAGYTYTFSVTGSTLNLVVSAPPAPGGFSATPSFGQVALSWTASPGATSYNVMRSTTNGGPYTTIASTSGTSYTDTSVTNGTTYYYVVAGVNTAGPGANSTQGVATPPTIPSPWVTADIGTTGATGSASYNSGNGTFTILGSGADITGTSDAFRYVDQAASGDCSIVAKIATIQNTNTLAKAGVMVRETTAANARYVGVFVTPGSGVRFQSRSSTGGSTTTTTKTGITAPEWVKITRTGNVFAAYYSSNGTSWTQIGSNTTIAMATSTTIGMGVTSKVSGTLCAATITNVTATP